MTGSSSPIPEAPAFESPVPASDAIAEITFRQLQLSEPIVEALESSGYSVPTPIQAQTIPLLLAGHDVLGQAQTGTGKTAAFALPMLQRIDIAKKCPQVLVLTPTRELAIQVAESFARYAKNMRGLRVVPIYGGQDYLIQFRQLDRGVHVVVGTPGRVMDHMRRGSLKLDGLRGLVLDEADEMLRMGFADDVEWVLTQSPAERQIALFSATLPEPIRRIAQKHLKNPKEITIHQQSATADTVRQRFLIAEPRQRELALGRILEAEPIDGVIVFCKMKSTTEPLAEFLISRGHRAAALNGDIPQKQRERIIEGLKAGKLDIVVATDVAARGLDVQRISHVINYDFPFDSEAYVHRIGRTGRAGRSGEAILFVHPRERGRLKRIERATNQQIEPMDIPSNRVINKQRVARFHERITAELARPDLEAFASVVDQYLRTHDIPMENIAAALAALAHGETPLLVKEEMPQATFANDSRSDRDHRGNDDSRSRSTDSGGPRRARSPRPDGKMETFRIDVGNIHQVKPGNIVGAIANETGLGSESIGRIEIFDDYSTVDLPEGMPNEIFRTLKRVWVSGCKLNISRLNDPRPQPAPRTDSPAKTKVRGKKGARAAKRAQLEAATAARAEQA